MSKRMTCALAYAPKLVLAPQLVYEDICKPNGRAMEMPKDVDRQIRKRPKRE